jgi:hypothetical protein
MRLCVRKRPAPTSGNRGTISHVKKDTTWCTINIDTKGGKVVVQQRWQYVWRLESTRMNRWTHVEQQKFHARATRAIWNAWSNRAMLKVEGTSEFAKRFRGREVPVFMDIRWVNAKPHWTVYVTKAAKKSKPPSNVGWAVRQIYLDTNDFMEREECFGPPKDICVAQMPVVHEFGHAMGNIGGLHGGYSDEYDERSLFSEDVASIMNRGDELRARHFNYMVNELRGTIPDTEFSLGRLQ